MDSNKIKEFQSVILDYWNISGRKNLPWRLTSDPWCILLSEILLRKTTSRQVISIYETITNLSPRQIRDMSHDELESILRPMGMYRVRAKQIHSIATIVALQEREALKDFVFLENLPGVGRYAFNAVLCFAFNCPKPALDTNMIRVISRVFGVGSKRSRAREDNDLWCFAETLVPANKCREFNWGILDLASAICKPHNQQCSSCPLSDICNFRNIEGNIIAK